LKISLKIVHLKNKTVRLHRELAFHAWYSRA